MHAFTPTPHLDALLDLTLAEDLGTGDATAALVPAHTHARAEIQAREVLVLCGAPVVERLLWRFGPGAPAVHWLCADGERVTKDTVVGHLEGDLRAMLTIERSLLNLLQRMSGVATQARRYVDAVAGTGARITDTRKTLPGHRLLDKYATRVGGAFNHRAGLDGGVLIKDNHLAACGGVVGAIARARATASHSLRIEVEVEDLAGLDAAIAAGAEVVLLDNFTPAGIAEAVKRADGRVLTEASGGIDLANVRATPRPGSISSRSGRSRTRCGRRIWPSRS